MKKALLGTCVVLMLAGTALCAAEEAALKTEPKGRRITVAFDQVKGPKSKVFSRCVGAGRANEGLRADWQRQLAIAKKECGFDYIRFHGIFHDDMGVYKEDKDGNPIYNFQYVDELYDYLLSIGVKPFVELSFMPAQMVSAEKTVFWWKANVSTPKSYERYGELIRRFVRHLTDRYGQQEVATWYFEVWNEPDHHAFFNGTKEDYFKMYSVAVENIKAVSKDYRVGGPATSGSRWIKSFTDYCAESHTPVDFVATHAYGVMGALDEFGTKAQILVPNADSVVHAVKRTREYVQQSNYPNMEIHYTEWSSSYSPRDPVHDTYFNAAFVLNTLMKTQDVATSMSYWVFSDIFEEAGPPTEAFHGGFGLMNLQGLKKPTYLAYQFLNQLGPIELVNEDTESWICKNNTGDIQCLIYDFTMMKQGKEVNQTFFKKDLPPQNSEPLSVTIQHVPNGTYACRVYRVGYRSNDVYSLYRELGSPQNLSAPQVQMLAAMADGKPTSESIVTIKDGQFAWNETIRDNDIFFIDLRLVSSLQ